MPVGGGLKRIAFVPAQKHDANAIDPLSFGLVPLNDPVSLVWSCMQCFSDSHFLVQRKERREKEREREEKRERERERREEKEKRKRRRRRREEKRREEKRKRERETEREKEKGQ